MGDIERKCRNCGWEGLESEIPGKDFREDYGDVYMQYCPKCGCIDWDCDLFEEVQDGRIDV